MDITIHQAEHPLAIDRGHVVSMIIKSFKGRKDVEVHLFRSEWDPELEEVYDWDVLVGSPMPGAPGDAASTHRVILESFSEEERDRIVAFLKTQYATRLQSITASPLNFPVPLGLPALSDMTAGKDIGFIRFDRIPSYDLDIPLAGLYDLSRHEPLVDPEEE
jgi:hypothetical protein